MSSNGKWSVVGDVPYGVHLKSDNVARRFDTSCLVVRGKIFQA